MKIKALKNKKGFMLNLIVDIIFIIVLLIVVVFFAPAVLKEREQQKAYTEFCKERPDFCYCEYFSCEFKTSWSSVTGFSEDTIALCKLAKSLNDTKTEFKAGCEI
jgi:hypothetical protein